MEHKHGNEGQANPLSRRLWLGLPVLTEAGYEIALDMLATAGAPGPGLLAGVRLHPDLERDEAFQDLVALVRSYVLDFEDSQVLDLREQLDRWNDDADESGGRDRN